MEFIELVKKRKSTRKYLFKPVPRDVLNRSLEAARLAPSACNSQPWYFIVVDDEALKNKVAEAAFSGVHSLNSFAKSAPVLIIVLREKTKFFPMLAGWFQGISYDAVDLGIACEHFVLQAEEDGVGTCWLGWFNERAARKIIGLPAGKRIGAIISMGYPEKDEIMPKNRKSIGEISRFNK